MDHVYSLLREKNLLSHKNQDILIVTTSPKNGLEFIKDFLYRTIDQKTFLLLSGGRTPKELYEVLAHEEELSPGAVGQVDERYGEPYHNDSNQKMIRDCGLLRYFQMRGIPFYPILTKLRHSGEEERRPQNQRGVSNEKNRSWTSRRSSNGGQDDEIRRNTASQYDKTLRDLFSVYHKSVGLLGIGLDGHTAGIPANKVVWEEFGIAKRSKTEYVIDYDDHGKFYNERITMTFAGLSMLDLLVILVFGDDKKEALERMFDPPAGGGKEEEIPARFYKRPEIAKKTVIFTDQRI